MKACHGEALAAPQMLRPLCPALGFSFNHRATQKYVLWEIQFALNKCGFIGIMILVNVLLYSLLLQGPDHQTILFNHGAVQNIAHLLTSPSYKVRCKKLCHVLCSFSLIEAFIFCCCFCDEE